MFYSEIRNSTEITLVKKNIMIREDAQTRGIEVVHIKKSAIIVLGYMQLFGKESKYCSYIEVYYFMTIFAESVHGWIYSPYFWLVPWFLLWLWHYPEHYAVTES